jgi:hypothetical protein
LQGQSHGASVATERSSVGPSRTFMVPRSTVSETSLMTLSPIETILTLSRRMVMRSGPPGGASGLKVEFLS